MTQKARPGINKNARMSKGDVRFETGIIILLAILTMLIIYPLVYVVSASFSDALMVAAGRVILWPVSLTTDNYAQVFKNQSLVTGFCNSMLIMCMGTALNLVMTVLAAYPLSRRNLWGAMC